MTRFLCNGEWLLEYAEGELSAADCAQAEAHLAACPGCSREVAALRTSREMLCAYFATADAPQECPSQADRDISWSAATLALASIAATALLVSMFFFLGRERGEVVKVVSPPAQAPIASPAPDLCSFLQLCIAAPVA